MPRLGRLIQRDAIFFVTTNLRRGLRSFSTVERDAICASLAELREQRQCRLAGFVVMPDHVHFLVLPVPSDSLSKPLQTFKYASGRKINVLRKRKGALWQKGFFDRFMRTPKEFLETLEYMHQNPVRKKLVNEPADWRWSSARAYEGTQCIIPVDFLDLPAQSEKRFW